MPFMTRIPADLARFGLTVETVPGWETRGSSSFAPGGVVCHWTAGPMASGSRPSLNVVTNGRPGLDGPLCNVYFDRRGICVVVAAGRANHAGTGSWRGLVGNSAVYGIEAEAGGPNDWTPAQRDNYPRLVAALLHGLGRGAEWAAGHSEWAGPRKTDINGYTMDDMRAQVASILANPSQEDIDVSAKDELWDAIVPRLDEMRGELDQLMARLPAIDSMHVGLMDPTAGVRNIVLQLAGRDPVDVDIHELAAQVAPLVSSNADALSDSELLRIAQAVADEQARRQAA